MPLYSEHRRLLSPFVPLLDFLNNGSNISTWVRETNMLFKCILDYWHAASEIHVGNENAWFKSKITGETIILPKQFVPTDVKTRSVSTYNMLVVFIEMRPVRPAPSLLSSFHWYLWFSSLAGGWLFFKKSSVQRLGHRTSLIVWGGMGCSYSRHTS